MTEKDNIINFNEHNCPRCKNTEYTIITVGKDYLHGIKGDFKVVECTACGLRYLNPSPHPSDIWKCYPTNYAPYADFANKRKENNTSKILKYPIQTWLDKINLKPDYIENGRILEIGCASGARLVKLQSLGWSHLEGIEMSGEAASIARNKGFQIYCDTVENTLFNLDDNSYDVVIMSMVIEHLFDPFKVVEQIFRVLKPDGQFLLSTVVYDSIEYKLFNEFWPGYDFPRHLVYFRTEDIISLLNDVGFQGIEITRQFAPQDMYRPASWRKRGLDTILAPLFKTKIGLLIHIVLAALNKTTRISVKCKKTLMEEK